MIAALIRAAVAHRVFVLLAALVLAAAGMFSLLHTPLERRDQHGPRLSAVIEPADQPPAPVREPGDTPDGHIRVVRARGGGERGDRGVTVQTRVQDVVLTGIGDGVAEVLAHRAPPAARSRADPVRSSTSTAAKAAARRARTSAIRTTPPAVRSASSRT